jgi:hypothetical protein
MLDIVKSPSTGNGNDATVSGRGLARRQLTAAELVNLAADFATGRQRLELSLTQIAGLTGVTTAQLRSELKARAQRRAVWQEAEQRLQVQLEAEAVNAQADAIVAAWDSASPLAREAAIRGIGVAHVWEVLANVIA